MRRRRFQGGGLSQRKRNGRLYWYLQWREDGRPRSKELGPCSEISRAHAEVMRVAIMEPLNKGILKSRQTRLHARAFHRGDLLTGQSPKMKVSLTTMTTEAMINAHLAPAFGQRLIEELTREDLQGLLDRTAASGLSRSVVAHLRWQMQAIFRLAMGEGVVSRNPTLGLSVPRFAAEPREKRVMSFEDVGRAMQVLPIRERLIFRLATIEGMRPGEILGLQPRDLDDRSLRVCRRVYRRDVDSPKTGRGREVALSPVTGSLLSEWTTLLTDQRPEAWLFQSENVRSPLMRDNVQRRFIQPKLADHRAGLGDVPGDASYQCEPGAQARLFQSQGGSRPARPAGWESR